MTLKVKIFSNNNESKLEQEINKFLENKVVGLINIQYYAIPAEIEQWHDEVTQSVQMRHNCIFTALMTYQSK